MSQIRPLGNNSTAVTGLMGENGGIVETGTTAVTGDFSAIQCLEDTVFSLLTRPAFSGDALTGVTFVAGTILYGYCTAFTLTSGKVVAYNRTTEMR
jgi:hypothetical protein